MYYLKYPYLEVFGSLAKWLDCSLMVFETWVQSQVVSYQRLKNWYLIPPCLTLSIISYGSMVKWSHPGKGVAPSPTPRCSSYWKGSLLVALDYVRQLYFYLQSPGKGSSQRILIPVNWVDQDQDLIGFRPSVPMRYERSHKNCLRSKFLHHNTTSEEVNCARFSRWSHFICVRILRGFYYWSFLFSLVK